MKSTNAVYEFRRHVAGYLPYFLLLTPVLLFTELPTLGAESHPGIDLESRYSEAVLALNKRQTDEALKILDSILKADPAHIESMELRALALKTSGNDAQAAEAYRKLLELKPEQDRGPYHFELGTLLNAKKDFKGARPHFEKSISLHFNTVAAHLFLGLMDFGDGNLTEAERHFSPVRAAENPELSMVGHYYTGLILYRNNWSTGGHSEMVKTRELAGKLPDSKTAGDLKAATDKILAPFQTPQWFASATLLGQYDSNITLSPATVSGAASSGKSTPNILFNAGAGRMSAPVDAIQWVGSLRMSGNKTLSAETKTYDFFTTTPAFYLTWGALKQTNGGIKLDAAVTFQRQLDDPMDATGGSTYHVYSWNVEPGLYGKHEFSRNWLVQLDLNWRKMKNFSDIGQSGSALNARASARHRSAIPWLTPSATFTFEKVNTDSDEFADTQIGVGVSNPFKITAEDLATFSLDFQNHNYSLNTQGRKDTLISARLSWIHTFTPKLTGLADLSFSKNSSNLPETFSWNRFQIGAGIGWSL